MKFAIMKDTKENSDCDWLQREYDEVNRTLLYVSAVVAQDRFEILPHSATIILDTITTMFNHFRTCPDITESSRMTSCQANVYQSLARFIHCTDSLLVSEPTSLDRDSAASVIGPLSSGIKELIQVWHHKKTGQKVSKPMTPHSQTNAFTLSNDCYGRTPLPDIPLTPREQQILVQTSMLDGCFDNNADRSRLHGKDGEDCDVFLFDVAHTERAVLASPPPKPPLPYHSNSVLPRSFQGGCLPSGPSEYINSAVGIVPPPLPAKQRLAQCRIDMSGAKSPATLSNREMDSSLMMSPTSMPISTHQTPDIAHTRSSSSGAPYYGSNPLAGMACVSCEQDSPLFPLTTASCFIGSHPTTVVPSCSKVPINTMSIPPIFNWTEEQTATVAGLSSNASYFSNAFSEPVAVIRKLNGSISENCLKISEITRSTSSTYNSCDNTPPPLPEKKFLLRRLMSQYDNVLGSSADAVVSSSMHEATPDSFVLSRPISPTPSSSSIFQASISSGSVPACVEGQTSCNHGNICLRSNNTCPSSSSCTYPPICLPQSPPPLPPKQRHVHAYMQTFGSMSHPISTVSSMSRQSIIFYETQWHRHETELKQHQCPQSHTSFDSQRQSHVSSDSSQSSSSCHLDIARSASCFCPSDTYPNIVQMVSHRVLPNTGESELSDVPIYSNDRNGHTTMTTTSTSPSLPSSSKSTNSRQSVGGVEETESLVGKAGTLSGNICGMAKINLLDCMDVCDHLILRKPDEDGPKIKGGSTDALVVHATIAGKSEFIFQEAFLTTYRTFLSHKQLISKLLYRFNQFRKILTGNRKIAQSVFSLLIRVIDELCMTELEDDLFKGQFSLVYDLLCEGELCLAKLLRRKLLEKWAKRQVVIGQARTIIRPIDSVSLQYSSAHDFLNFKPLDIAEQMTLLDARLFLNIEVQEVLLWAKEQSEEQSPNLTTFTEHFNKMSYWCRTQILTQDDAKEREKYLNKMIKIMRNLRKLKNFNSYLAILSALDSAPVRRLQWQKQNVEALHEVCQLIDSSSSFRTYRYALADTEPPCIPYLGLILQDLTFINIGNKDCLPDGRVNFNKRWQQFNVLDSMRRFKTTLYSLKRSEKIQAVLNNFDDYCSEDVLWQISQQIKPRQSHQKQHSLP